MILSHSRRISGLLAIALVCLWAGIGCGGSGKESTALQPVVVSYQVKPTGSMAHGRFGHSATLLKDGRVLVVGGRIEAAWGTPLASAEIYDPATGQFSSAGELSEPRTNHSATILPNGRVVIIGGVTTNGAFLRQIEIWDPTTKSFFGHGGLQLDHSGHSCFLRQDGQIQVVGGYNSGIAPDASATYTEIYDPVTSTSRLDFKISNFRKNSLLLPIDAERFLLIGGENGDGFWHQLDLCELYTTSPNQGEPNLIASTKLLKPIRPFDGVKMPNGTFVVCGGYNQISGDSDLAQLISLSENTISISSIKLKRDITEHQTIVLPDNRVGIVGGETFTGLVDTSYLDTIDAVNIEKQSFETLPLKFSIRRSSNVTVRLLDGRYLITGGYAYSYANGGSFPATATCDILEYKY